MLPSHSQNRDQSFSANWSCRLFTTKQDVPVGMWFTVEYPIQLLITPIRYILSCQLVGTVIDPPWWLLTFLWTNCLVEHKKHSTFYIPSHKNIAGYHTLPHLWKTAIKQHHTGIQHIKPIHQQKIKIYPIGSFLKLGYPYIIHVIFGFSLVNHPAIGVPQWLWKPPSQFNTDRRVARCRYK